MNAKHLPTSDYLAHFRYYRDTKKYLITPPTQIQAEFQNKYSFFFLLVKLIHVSHIIFQICFFLKLSSCTGLCSFFARASSLTVLQRQCLVHPFYTYKMRLSLSDLLYLSLSSTKELFHWHRSSNQNKMVPIWLEPVGLLAPRFVFDTTNVEHAA